VVIEQPELVVAEGSILADAALLAAAAAAPGPTAELRLVSSGRADSARVRVASAQPAPPAATQPSPPAAHVPGTTGLQPPVDPWPDADHGHWVPDPDATVPTPRHVVAPHVPTNSARTSTRPTSPAGPVSSPPQAAGKAKAQKGKTRTGAAPKEAARKASPPTRAMARPTPARPKARRRTRRFVRFLQILVSILVMIVVPLAALLIAYGWGNGDPIRQDATNLVRDIANLLGLHYE
jgi:hypothetical protein